MNFTSSISFIFASFSKRIATISGFPEWTAQPSAVLFPFKEVIELCNTGSLLFTFPGLSIAMGFFSMIDNTIWGSLSTFDTAKVRAVCPSYKEK